MTLTKVHFGPKDTWPEVKPFLFVVRGVSETDLSHKPKWDKDSRTLLVSLPQATIAKTRISSSLSINLGVMGIWELIQQSPQLTPQDIRILEHNALQGRLWMMTPFRELVFVHAVQQPLGTPGFVGLQVIRRIGETFATLSDKPVVHIRSTGKVDMIAEWTEMTDDILEDKPKAVNRKANVFDFKLDYPDPLDTQVNSIKIDQQRHEFGDTKYREVKYTIVSTSRFREYFILKDPGLKRISIKINLFVDLNR